MSQFFDLWGYTALNMGKDRGHFAHVKNARSNIHLGQTTLDGIAQFISHRVDYREDATDHWSSPANTLDRGHGDCEDFAILARSLFIEAGGLDENAALILVKDLQSSRIGFVAWHMVAVFLVDGTVMMIDSGHAKAVPASEARDYIPVIAYCGDDIYVYGSRLGGAA